MFDFLKKKPYEPIKYNVRHLKIEFEFLSGEKIISNVYGRVKQELIGFDVYAVPVYAEKIFHESLAEYNKIGFVKIALKDSIKYYPMSSCKEIKIILDEDHYIKY